MNTNRRNAPWPKEVYTVQAESLKIVVRTSNKKYFTRIPIPDLDRCGIQLDSSLLDYDWANATLVITYQKPVQILELERKEKEERKKLVNSTKEPKDGDVQCPQS